MICKHFPECGGCQTMNLTDAQAEENKRNFVLHEFRRKSIEVEIGNFISTSLYSRRRATLTGKRTKKSVQLGFLSQSTHNIVNIEECLVISRGIFAIKDWVKDQIPLLASRSAQLKFHITECENGFDIAIDHAKSLDPSQIEKLCASAKHANIRRLILGSDVVYFDEQPFVIMANARVALPPKPFLQASVEAENTIRKLAHMALLNCNSIADLFSGIGTLSYGLKSTIHAFEGNKALSRAHQQALNANQIANCKPVLRDLFREPLQSHELNSYDGVIIDPPRAGAEAQCRELARSGVKKIAFVSCDAKTLARDAEILISAGYKMRAITLIDQFRFTQHIELFALFEKLA